MAEAVDSIDDLRQKGNHEFQQGNLDHAISFYTAAIQLASSSANNAAEEESSLVVNLCNRSACHFQLEDYDQAEQDAQQAWKKSRQTNVKAAYRLGKTLLMAKRDFGKAIDVVKTALDLDTLQEKERSSLQDLLEQVEGAQKAAFSGPATVETTIKGANRPVSVREFKRGEELGVGNFSEIVIVTHNVTKETFALKILERKQAADLAKRQHPNVYNEIAMEARVLLKRLPPHRHVITMYHAFEDYYNLYYLMDLHRTNIDLWGNMKYHGQMVGTHPSMTKRWMMQLIDAVEHLHSHGIVHRDLKPENILLNERNHVVVVDFGTAKDLIETDLNGPEFVGTPDFMSPEAVTGFSGMPKDAKKEDSEAAATHCADLWALGAVAVILHTGTCPFWSPSPYLTFLRIKRGLLPRNEWGIPDDDAWDFCRSLMHVKPADRLGADCFAVSEGSKPKVAVRKGYDVLRSHPYLAKVDRTDNSHIIPSLQDLCIRACAELAKKDAVDLDICDEHPPGDGSRHDLTRLSDRQRCLVWHTLDKCKTFKDGDETRVFQRFFDKDVEFLRNKVRQSSRDFVGLTQMNDDEYKIQSQRGSQDPYAKKADPEPTKVVVLRNPGLVARESQSEEEDAARDKRQLKGWKNCVAHINKQRPKAVVVCSQNISAKYWKFLARVRDSIPVIWNDGSVYYSFWLNGFQGIVLQRSGLMEGEDSLQMQWLREQMEQSRMAKQQIFAFCDCDPRELPAVVLKRLARGHVLCLYGTVNPDLPLEGDNESVEYNVVYEPNERLHDDSSVKSTESKEDEEDGFTMKVIASNKNGVDWLTVQEAENWSTSFEAVDMPN